MSVRKQKHLRKDDRNGVNRVTIGCSSLDPMIIQSCRRQREAVWLCKDHKGAGMHLQCNCRHWIVIIRIINNNNLQTIYICNSFFITNLPLKYFLHVQPSLLLLQVTLDSIFTLSSTLPGLYTLLWKYGWNACRRRMMHKQKDTLAGQNSSRCKQAQVREVVAMVEG